MNNTLSLCLIAKDASTTISESIKSIRELVDEIVVVDLGSKDQTARIAKENGAKVFNFRWNGDFSAARNFALAKIESDWIMVLEADEILVGGTEENFATLFSLSQEKIPLYFFDLFSGINSKKPKEFSYYQREARLFPNNGFQYRHSVKENIYHPNGSEDLACLTVRGMAIKKYISGGLKSYSQKTVPILKKELEKNPESFYYNYHLGKECLLHGFYAKALISYNKALESEDFKNEVYLADICTDIIKIFYRLKDTSEALNECLRRQTLCSDNPDYWFTYGFIALQEGDLKCAESCLLKCLEKEPQADYLIINIDNITWKPQLLLGYVYLRLKDFEKAKKHLQQALRYKSNEWRLLFYLSIACRNLKEYESAEAYLKATDLIVPKESRQNVKFNFLLNCIMSGDFNQAGEIIKVMIKEYEQEPEEFRLLEL